MGLPGDQLGLVGGECWRRGAAPGLVCVSWRLASMAWAPGGDSRRVHPPHASFLGASHLPIIAFMALEGSRRSGYSSSPTH